MTNLELQQRLKELPSDQEVYIMYDGETRMQPNVVYASRNCKIILTDFNEPCYTKGNKP